MDKHREASLKRLREIGVVHIEQKDGSSNTLSDLLKRKEEIETALGILSSHEIDAKIAAKAAKKSSAKTSSRFKRASDYINPEGVPFSIEALDAPDRKRDDLIRHVVSLEEKQKFLKERTTILSWERSNVESWGSFNPEDIHFLRENGYEFYLYEIASKDLESLPADVPYIIAGRSKTTVCIVTFGKDVPGRTPFETSENSLVEIDSLLADIKNQLAEINRQLVSLVLRRHIIEAELKTLIHEIEFETINAGMGLLEDAPAESSVCWITGFVPSEDLGLLKRAAAEDSWALLADDPAEDDQVPTKLKNNRFASLIYPLTTFLEIVPGYREVDISGWFLVFFTIFFGMIFGDAVYGAMFMVIALTFIFKARKKGAHPFLKVLLLWGISNFLWGVLTCTWLGMEVEKVPQVLRLLSLPQISNVTAVKSVADEAIVRQNLMIFCFSLALLHLSIGHIVKIFTERSLKILGELGSIAMLCGMYGVVLSLIVSNEYRPIPLFQPCIYMIGVGFVANFVFESYEGSIGGSIVASLKNIISKILGVVNVFGDIMSYIRLWAVGLAGAAIAGTVNQIAGPMLGRLVLLIFGLALMIFGHGLNVVLNALSVLVHGVRLNILEFSGHVGLTWAGTPYKPFSEPAGMKPVKEVPKKA